MEGDFWGIQRLRSAKERSFRGEAGHGSGFVVAKRQHVETIGKAGEPRGGCSHFATMSQRDVTHNCLEIAADGDIHISDGRPESH